MPGPESVTVTQLQNDVLRVEWVWGAVPIPSNIVATGSVNPPPQDDELIGVFLTGTLLLVDVSVWTPPPVAGDIVEIGIQNGDDNDYTHGQTTWLDMAGAQWTTIADVRTMLGVAEAGFTDEQITAAITAATARLESVFCKDVEVDDVTGLPLDPNVQSATTVMASRILVTPATGVPPVQGGQITSERMGSYSYSVRPGTTPKSAGPLTIDGYLKDLVGGYLCPGYAGIPAQTDIWPYDAANIDELAALPGVTTP